MAKYPGSFIINEVGTRKELAGLYGVSERTIYRWLNRAAKESGLTPKPRKSMPAPKALAAFKGTRKQLAAKYGISERTVYRWLNKAKESSTLPAGSLNRTVRSKYPGVDILNIPGKNKEVAEQFGVSERTVSRWKRRARLEQASARPEPETPTTATPTRQTTFEEFTEEAYRPENIIEPPEIEQPEPVFEEPVEAPGIEDEDLFEVEDIPEELKKYGFEPETLDTIQFISDFIEENDLIVKNSLFNDLSADEKLLYITEYIRWQWETNPRQFNQSPTSLEEAIHAGVHRLSIWGEEFESWLTDFYVSNQYEL